MRTFEDEVLAIDFGGVICVQYDKSNTEDTSFFGDDFRKTPQVDGAFESIAQLRQAKFRRVCVISKGSLPTQERTKEWLRANGFYVATGLSPNDVYFCEHRTGKDPLARRLGVTLYVDNDPRVLTLMDSVRLRYPFQSTAEHLRECTPADLAKFYRDPSTPLRDFKPLPNWRATVAAILAS